MNDKIKREQHDKALKLAEKWYDNFTKTVMNEEQGMEFIQECGDAIMVEAVMRLIAVRKCFLGD